MEEGTQKSRDGICEDLNVRPTFTDSGPGAPSPGSGLDSTELEILRITV